jgi:predicted PurR-regulated permease PerM
MRIHPALGFIAAIAGVALIGPVGALLALPIVATVQSFASTYLTRHAVVDSDLLEDSA